MFLRPCAVGAAFAVLALTTPVRAAPYAQQYGWEKPFALSFQAGLRTPFGTGLSYEVAPVVYLPLEIGVGGAYGGVQLAAFARARIPFRSMAVSAGFGYSRGPFHVSGADCFLIIPIGGCAAVGSTAEYSWNAAIWRNVELSFDRRTEWGLQWRLYLGFRNLLNSASGRCSSSLTLASLPPVPEYCRPQPFATEYAGLALGYAF